MSRSTFNIARSVGVRVALGAGATALGLATWQGVASAGVPPTTVPMQYHGGDCGFPVNEPTIGSASFERLTSNHAVLVVQVDLQDASPNTIYTIYLYNGANCDTISTLGFLKTDSAGQVSHTYTHKVGTKDEFFVAPHANGYYNDSLIATVPE